MTHCCDICGEPVFTGRFVNYEYRPGNWKQDITGRMEDGAGQCDSCGKYFCAFHKELDDGLCPECQKKYLPEETEKAS
jgi:predicted nucleic acid binding AN1-type Zn finger protein